MWARHSTAKGSPDKYDEAVKVINERAIPAIKDLPGFVAGYWGLNRETGDGFVVTLWEDEESLRASSAAFPAADRYKGPETTASDRITNAAATATKIAG